MKRIKKITSIALITILCFSFLGCYNDFLGSRLYRILFSESVELGKIEAESQQQALDSVPKEVEGYKLKLDYTEKLYKTDNSWVELKNMKKHNYTTEYNGITATVEAMSYEVIDSEYCAIFCLKEYYQNEIITEKKAIIPQSRIDRGYGGYNVYFQVDSIYCVDGVWFYIGLGVNNNNGYRLRTHYTACYNFPPLFYLIDFENEEIYYAGYADGWYEHVQAMNYVGNGLYYNTWIKVEKE